MAYKCRTYPAPEQAAALNRTFGCVRLVWNRTLAWRHARYHGEHAKTNFTQANAYLTGMKATEYQPQAPGTQGAQPGPPSAAHGP
jgi:putative transposase